MSHSLLALLRKRLSPAEAPKGRWGGQALTVTPLTPHPRSSGCLFFHGPGTSSTPQFLNPNLCGYEGNLYFFSCLGCPYEGFWGRKVIPLARTNTMNGTVSHFMSALGQLPILPSPWLNSAQLWSSNYLQMTQ